MYSKILCIVGCLICHVAVAQNSSITGKIITSDGKPAAFVNISIKENNKSSISREDGSYTIITGNECTCMLVVSYVGLKTLEKVVSIQSGENVEVNFQLQEDARELEEVIVNSALNINRRPVTADKAGIAIKDLPQSVGIVSAKVISDQQANRLGDIVKNVSGVSLTQQRQGVAETFTARGYSIGISGAGGSIFKNGIITNTMGFPEASSLESVEVLKGSSALLYGNTSGGVLINMVTKKPRFTKGGEVSMRYGSYHFYKPTADVYGPLNKNLAYRLIGTYENANSFRDQVKTKRVYVNPSLFFKPGKKTTLLLQGDYLSSDFIPDYGIGILNANMDAVIPTSRSRFINFPWAYYHLDQATGSLTLDHKLSNNWKINFIAAGQKTKVDAFGSAVPNAIKANGDFARVLSRSKTFENNYTIQFNFIGNFTTAFLKHQLLTGTDAVRVVTGNNTFQFFNNGVPVGTAYDTINILGLNDFVKRADMPDARDTALTTSVGNRVGIYIQDLISINDKLKILAGLRWSYIKTMPTTIFNQISQSKRKGTAAVESKAFSPKLAIIYQPVKSTSIYTSYSNNFAANTGIDIYGAQLKPSVTDQFEVGIKNDLMKEKLSINVSVYRIINHNFAQRAPFKADGTVNSDSNIKELSGETTSDGFEIDINGTIFRNFYFITGYGNNYMRYTRTSGIKGSNVEGEQLINNPRHTFNATVFYTFENKVLKGLKIGASAFYTGNRLGGIQNTVEQAPAYNRLIPLRGFTTIDFSGGYTYKKISLQLKISNIANTLNYLAHDHYSINPIPPRQFAGTLAYQL